ncbi:general substrate transporter [Penicillium cataractarum]|uniref:General substrate transporter n=1 Tax=Penicillium cataractarum TaxID=2100454 RepID=A0A9W9SHX8_9EURO|nr:general substrate transporter [Penicillium cataractarum]KAJ5378315.1 general substrate transporter [Penicillium cataractarum]
MGYFFGARGSMLAGAMSSASSIAFLLVGWDQGVLGGVLSGKLFLSTLGNPSASELGTITAVYDLGCLGGSLMTMFYGEKLGRRWSTMIGLSIVIVGAILQTCTFSGGQMIAGRIIAGVGNGISTATVPTWNSEIVGSHNRGRLNAISGSMIGLGICLSYWFDYGMAYTSGSIQWRLPIAIQLLFAGATLFMAIFLPESPRWLITQGRVDEATDVLACLESKTSTPETPAVVAKCQDIQLALNAEQALGPLKWAELWENKVTGNRKRLILACGIMVFQQMSGINALVYYIPYLLANSVGLAANMALLISGLVGVVFVVFSAYAFFFIDRWGRRKPFIITSLVQSLSMTLVAILLSLNNTNASKASVVFFFLYMAAFGACYLGVPWSYAPELLPLRNRARGCAIASAVNWTCNFAIVEFVPSAITNISWRTYIIFAVLNFTWAPLLYLFYPETARLTMEEIDNLFVKEPIQLHTLTTHASDDSENQDGKVAIELEERT